jgi:hypothetical protein
MTRVVVVIVINPNRAKMGMEGVKGGTDRWTKAMKNPYVRDVEHIRGLPERVGVVNHIFLSSLSRTPRFSHSQNIKTQGAKKHGSCTNL